MKKARSFAYTIPEDAEEICWAAAVLWRDPKDGHRNLTTPWEVSVYIKPEERRMIQRLGKAISKTIISFAKAEKKRAKKMRAKKVRST